MALKILKTFTLRWWEVGIFKAGMLGLGLAAGAYWHDLVAPFALGLAALAAIALAYITVIWWKQR